LSSFAAIDFETSHFERDSACAVGVALVRDGMLVRTFSSLIRPPRRRFMFTEVHGLTRADVEGAPDFVALWPDLAGILAEAEFLVAHNAAFDRSVLHGCCSAAGIAPPPHPFVCTMRLARDLWGLYPTKLSDVCRHLVIELNHHEALSDAVACARIAIAALQDGYALEPAAVG
jgi:DNA polymerase-3 subunit epsilon